MWNNANHSDRIVRYLPQNIAQRCILIYILILIIVSVAFPSYALPWWLLLWGTVSVVIFFQYSAMTTHKWLNLKPLSFEHKVLISAMLIRLAYAIFIYYFNYYQYGSYGESNHDDADWYVPTGVEIAEGWRMGKNIIKDFLDWGVEFTDMGYVVYLAVINYLTLGISDVIIPLMIKSVWGAYTCVFIYRIGTRHFGEHVGRMAAVFCMLNPNMIFWSGSMMKETEMLCLSACFINSVDSWLQQGRPDAKHMVITILTGMAMFTMRMALAAVQVASIAVAVLFSKSRVISTAKKIWVTALLAVVLAVGMGGAIYQDLKSYYEYAVSGDMRAARYEKRATRGGEDSNTFAKYASATLFAPMIFTVPFPSMVYTNQSQEMQMMVNGGNYIKNILSYFIILAMFLLLLSGDWRYHVLPIAVLCGYLIALVFSDFAHSGRFHMPALPLEMMFAAYGISIMKTKKKYSRWFILALGLEIVICIGWNWIKLSGRGYL